MRMARFEPRIEKGLAVVQNTCNFECPVFQTLPLYPTGVYQNQTQTPPDLDFANIYDSLEHFIMSSTPKHNHEIGVHWNSLRKRSILPGGFGDDRVALWYVHSSAYKYAHANYCAGHGF